MRRGLDVCRAMFRSSGEFAQAPLADATNVNQLLMVIKRVEPPLDNFSHQVRSPDGADWPRSWPLPGAASSVTEWETV